MWHHTTLFHSQKDSIELFARETPLGMEVAISGYDRRKTFAWFVRDLFAGGIDQISFDQHRSPIRWESEDHVDFSPQPRWDTYRPPRTKPLLHRIDLLNHHVANAINDSRTNRGYSRYLKHALVGAWTSGELSLELNEDGRFRMNAASPVVGSALGGAPPAGRWGIASNMLWLLDDAQKGIRTQVVDVRDGTLLLPGVHGQLHYGLHRAQ